MSIKRRMPVVAFAILLLAAVCVLLMRAERRSDRSFRQLVTEIDTSRVTAITIEWPGNDTILSLNRQLRGWVVTVPTGDMAANTPQIDELLGCLSAIEAQRQMTNSESAWHRYGVAADSSTHIVVSARNRVLADFRCGRVGIDVQRNRVWTYVRNSAEPNVYMTDGYLNLMVNKPFASWCGF